MREIKFRGKNESGWHYGLLTFMFGQYAISHIEDENTVDLVDKETVGQYTGLKDKNGIEIYEGDVVKWFSRFGVEVGKIEFARYGFHVVLESTYMYRIDEFQCAVIGNIYENPELLNG